jgi:L-lactate dehydrogenase (cytochrome)/(S)-mandelate dehydrogenase
MKLEQALSITDLRRLAKRRLPRVLFEAIESGVEDERGLVRNEEAFRGPRLLPRYLVDLSTRDQSVRLFDEVVPSPFGISPTGIAGVRMSPVRPNRAASPAGMRKPPHLRSDHLRWERPRSAIRASIVALIATRICLSLAMFPKS